MLGLNFKGWLSGYWIKLTAFEAILLSPIHGHIYTLTSDNCLWVYKYWEGDVSKSVADINQAFFVKLSEYLSSNKLAGLLDLEVLENILSSWLQMLEFVLAEEGMVIIKKEELIHMNIYKVTEWSFILNEDDIVLIKEYKTHADVNERHEIFRNTKLLRNINVVINLLYQEGLIKNSHWLHLSSKQLSRVYMFSSFWLSFIHIFMTP